ncbi:MAG: prolipoprotein diacylglyceryl transferase [Actinomycetales bacterium]|uniref:prolipoprotein diacylglyceryl transferase n=1 Tax=uncultured Salinibacterium sp. TaxID=459274 RepID=UPI0030DB63ED|tara:strand:- start:1918 stop:2775 length:858 start_codon:yes stop_codon:yes gene_type:complete
MLPLVIPSPDISFVELGPIRIYFYALFMLAAIAAAILVAGRRMRRLNIASGVALDIAAWAVPIGILGGRLYHVATHPSDYFYEGADLFRVLYVWEGGLAIFGSITFGALGAWIGARRAGVSFGAFADALAPGLLLGQVIGRIGNYFNQELFGAPTILPWGLQIDANNPAFPEGLPSSTLFHPLFLYEMLWNLVGIAVVLGVERIARRRAGVAIGTYFLWYGIGRAWFESFRLDPTELELFGVKINIVTALVAAIVGAWIIATSLNRKDSVPKSFNGKNLEQQSRD